VGDERNQGEKTVGIEDTKCMKIQKIMEREDGRRKGLAIRWVGVGK
jgi:hypothetical protein